MSLGFDIVTLVVPASLRSRVTLRKAGQVELSGKTPKQLSAARC